MHIYISKQDQCLETAVLLKHDHFEFCRSKSKSVCQKSEPKTAVPRCYFDIDVHSGKKIGALNRNRRKSSTVIFNS